MSRFLTAIGVGGAFLLAVLGAPAVSGAAPARGTLQVVQAVPGASVDVVVDGRPLRQGVRVGTVLGPLRLAPGPHEVSFTAKGATAPTRTSVTVRPGGTSDVVLHLPTSAAEAPVVNVYSTPRTPVGPGKARVLLAHTATVAPADVRVDGQTVFTNIANGEFAQADVPAGEHQVALLPTGQTSTPILGPLPVTLEARTLTMVYAVGSPKDGSMDVIAHVVRLSSDGNVAPDSVQTGSAGLASGIRVRTFGATRPAGRTPAPTSWWSLPGVVGGPSPRG